MPWAEPGSQFTAWFERLAVELLRECPVKGAAGLLRLTWDEAWGIKERAVARGLSRRTRDVVAHLGVDEKAIAKRPRTCMRPWTWCGGRNTGRSSRPVTHA